MFRRQKSFKADGSYSGHEYMVLPDGRVDVRMEGRIVRFNSVEELTRVLGSSGEEQGSSVAPPAAPAAAQSSPFENLPSQPQASASPTPRKKSGCGCLVAIVALLVCVWLVMRPGSETQKVADILNQQFGNVSEARIEGLSSDTLRLDWKANTTRLHTITIMAAIGGSKETMYSKGIRYFKFPNDAGGYNIVDWKTGEKTSISERAPYYF